MHAWLIQVVAVPVPPTVIVRSNEPLIAVETRDLSSTEISIEFSITRDYPSVEMDGIVWSYRESEESLETVNTTMLDSDDSRISFSGDLTTLTILDVNFFDAGLYTLSATNEAGTHNNTIELVVHGEE